MNTIQFMQEHQAAITATAMGIVHFSHLAWPRIIAIFPYCRDNGGVFGLINQFLKGKPGSAGVPPASLTNKPNN